MANDRRINFKRNRKVKKCQVAHQGKVKKVPNPPAPPIEQPDVATLPEIQLKKALRHLVKSAGGSLSVTEASVSALIDKFFPDRRNGVGDPKEFLKEIFRRTNANLDFIEDDICLKQQTRPQKDEVNPRRRYSGIVTNMFVGFGYISCTDLDTNIFFVPSHVENNVVSGRIPIGVKVEFTVKSQPITNGCKWIAIKVWLKLPDEIDSSETSDSDGVESDFATPNPYVMVTTTHQPPVSYVKQQPIARVLSLDTFTECSDFSSEFEICQDVAKLATEWPFPTGNKGDSTSLFTDKPVPLEILNSPQRQAFLQDYSHFGLHSNDFVRRSTGIKTDWKSLDNPAEIFRHDGEWMERLRADWLKGNL